MLDSYDEAIVHIGIDLGTTNSSIAINGGSGVELARNIFGDESTPSVFGVDKAGNYVVGKKAYERLYKSVSSEESGNYKGEVKRLMGTSDTIRINRLNKDLTPEEISAEILKSLKGDALRAHPNLPSYAAVITVPALFETMQNEATKRAGKLAGFDHVILVQEPIAAAIAYGFERHTDETWLVYDFGGGTFDAAVISSQDGMLSVLGHYGDNFSGGKDIDNLIVEEIIKPRLQQAYDLVNFDKARYFTAHAKLKAIAENAKIELTSFDQVSVDIEGLGVCSTDGRDVELTFILTRSELEQTIAPLVDKTIESAQRAIADAGLSCSDISKTILVGGTTLIPYVRKRIEEGIGAPIDTSVNPLTIVAQGAATYALGQQVPSDIVAAHRTPTTFDALELELNYDALTADADQLITGTLAGSITEGCFIQIASESGRFSSGRIPVRNGSFYCTVDHEMGKTTRYNLRLFDPQGNTLAIHPSSFTVTQGITIGGAPLSHGIGVVYSEFSPDGTPVEACDLYFDRDRIPPLEEVRSYRTARELKHGQTNALPIKVYEGDSENPDLNLVLTRLEIKGDALPYDLPKNTDIDITISIDESRNLSVEAYIPDIDLELDARVDMSYQEIDERSIFHDLEKQQALVDEAAEYAPHDEIRQISQEIRRTKHQLETNKDTDSKLKAVRDTRAIKEQVAGLRSRFAIARTSHELDAVYQDAQQFLEMMNNDDRRRYAPLVGSLYMEGLQAIKNGSEAETNRIIEQMRSLVSEMLSTQPDWWIAFLKQLSRDMSAFTDYQSAQQHVNEAWRAVQFNNFEALKTHVMTLISLMPPQSAAQLPFDFAGITK